MPAKLSFEEWMREVDNSLVFQVGLGHLDLPDWDYRDAYDDEMPPIEAASYVLEEAGWEMPEEMDHSDEPGREEWKF